MVLPHRSYDFCYCCMVAKFSLYVLVESWWKAMKEQLALIWLLLDFKLDPTFRSLIQN